MPSFYIRTAVMHKQVVQYQSGLMMDTLSIMATTPLFQETQTILIKFCEWGYRCIDFWLEYFYVHSFGTVVV